MTKIILLATTALMVCVTGLLGSATASAAAYTFQTVTAPPGTAGVALEEINDFGTIAGYYENVDKTPDQGFTLTLPGTFTAENYPGAAKTAVTGVNSNGGTTGFYIDAAGMYHGFTKIGGIFQTVDAPSTAFNESLRVNDSNVAVGWSSTDPVNGRLNQVAYSQSGGVFTNIGALLPSNSGSQAGDINNAGYIVGRYSPTTGKSEVGFLDAGGTISTIDPFGVDYAAAIGINNTGEIVGAYTDGPGGTGAVHGFIDIGGNFTSFDAPNAVNETVILGVNDLGQLAGTYLDSNGESVGFIATPSRVPEPTSMALLGCGLAGLAVGRRRGRG